LWSASRQEIGAQRPRVIPQAVQSGGAPHPSEPAAKRLGKPILSAYARALKGGGAEFPAGFPCFQSAGAIVLREARPANQTEGT
jgi:hypothetical protein